MNEDQESKNAINKKKNFPLKNSAVSLAEVSFYFSKQQQFYSNTGQHIRLNDSGYGTDNIFTEATNLCVWALVCLVRWTFHLPCVRYQLVLYKRVPDTHTHTHTRSELDKL